MSSRIGLIGPNAILQLLPVIERLGGPERVTQMLANAGVIEIPDGQHMIAEEQAARLHRQLRIEEPVQAAALATEAGRGTADYILAHRIPRPVQLLLKLLPPDLAARLLSRAIARHAWTFAGSGKFRVIDPWTFEITRNPLIRGERSEACLCHWHVAVFQRLYQELVARHAVCLETVCAAQVSSVCRFKLRFR